MSPSLTLWIVWLIRKKVVINETIGVGVFFGGLVLCLETRKVVGFVGACE